MRFRIHFTVGTDEDSFVVSGESVEEIQAATAQELSRRGLDADKNDCWSEPED